MELSILIIFCQEKKEMLKNLLNSLTLSAGKIPFEVIIVNNGGKDISDISKTFENVFIIENKKNLGVAKARNQTVLKSQGKVIIFVDCDLLPEEKGIEKMFEYLISHQDIGAIAPAIFSPEGLLHSNFGSLPCWKFPFCEIFNLPSKNRLNPRLGLSEFLATGGLMIKREIFNKIGYFDEKFFYGFEDADWSKRAKEKGIKLFYFPQVKLLHFLHQSVSKTGARQIDFYVSEVYYFRKHFGKLFALVLKLFIITFSFLRIVVTLFRGGRRETRKLCWKLTQKVFSTSTIL